MDKILRKNIEIYKNRNLKLWMSRFSYESKSKNKLLFHNIKKSNIRLKNLNIFDFGFGNGLNLFTISKNNNVYGIEIIQNMIDFAERKAAQKKYNYFDFKLYDGVGKIDFPDSQFDIIICSHVLEHHPDDGLIMREFERILKADGRIFILIPMNFNGNEEDVHYRKYSVNDIRRIFKEHNFTILQEVYFDKLSRIFHNYLYLEEKEPFFKFIIKLIINFFLSIIPFEVQKFMEDKVITKVSPTQLCMSLTSNYSSTKS